MVLYPMMEVLLKTNSNVYCVLDNGVTGKIRDWLSFKVVVTTKVMYLGGCYKLM